VWCLMNILNWCHLSPLRFEKEKNKRLEWSSKEISDLCCSSSLLEAIHQLLVALTHPTFKTTCFIVGNVGTRLSHGRITEMQVLLLHCISFVLVFTPSVRL